MMRKMKVLLAGAAACLAWTALGAFQSVTVASGESITIGDGVNNERDSELVAEAGWTEKADKAIPYTEEDREAQMEQWRLEDRALKSEYFNSVL